jgi:hypothetical protein
MPSILLDGRTFPLRDTPPKSGAMLPIAAAEQSGDHVKAMALYYRLIVSLIDPDVNVDEVDTALANMDQEDIGKALEDAARTFTQDPTLPAQNTSGRSSNGSQAAKGTSRVVSFSQAAS